MPRPQANRASPSFWLAVLVSVLLLALLADGCAGGRAPAIYALLETDLGTIVCRLYTDRAPNATDVFQSFANGTLAFVDPKQEGKQVRRPLYDGTEFYAVTADRYIEAGDPGGDGSAGPGVRFQADIAPDLTHDRPGLLGMVPYGEGTYGSQFYITLAPMPEYDGKRAIFGEVAAGLDVARAISRVEATDGRPRSPVRIQRVRIVSR